MPSWVWTSSRPARRRARLMSTGRSTRVMPYSERATTVRPSRAGVVQQRGHGRVEVGGGLVGAGVVGAVALQVVVEVREVAQGQVGVAGAR